MARRLAAANQGRNILEQTKGSPIPTPGPGQAEIRSSESLAQKLVVLFKLRVVWLLLFAAIGGAFLAAGAWPGHWPLLTLTLSGGLTAAGASAMNQYLERDSDARMRRTRDRPLVTGPLSESRLLPWAAALMILLPSLVVLSFNPTLAAFLLLGALIYLGIYTIWLKPRTPLNIVIGGAAGTVAVLSGSAAVGHWQAPAAVVLSLVVFLWTPTHFWSLAIIYRDDYAAGGIPMLPAQVSPRAAAFWVLLHTAAAALGALALAFQPPLGVLYGLTTALASLLLLWRSVDLVLRPGPARAHALFRISNAFLGLVLIMIYLDTLF